MQKEELNIVDDVSAIKKVENLRDYIDDDDSTEVLCHCMQDKCHGIWFVDKEEDKGIYMCPVCQRYNCLKCQVIHEGMTCEEYKARLKHDHLPSESKPTWKCEFCEYSDNLRDIVICVYCSRTSKIMDSRKYTTTEHYRLLELEESNNFVPSFDKFECSICTEVIEPNNGVQLRGCLDNFCFACIRTYIEGNDQLEIKCPLFGCTNVLEDREIKTLISPEGYARRLEISLNVGKTQFKNGYQCCVANCRGWWIYVETDGRFVYDCPVCQTSNCISCHATHPNIDCKTYQQNAFYSTDPNGIQIRERLEEMLKDGSAEHCPTCNVIVVKNGGCAHMICAMCQAKFDWGQNSNRHLNIM